MLALLFKKNLTYDLKHGKHSDLDFDNNMQENERCENVQKLLICIFLLCYVIIKSITLPHNIFISLFNFGYIFLSVVNNFFLIIQVITSVVVGLTLFASLILIVGACGNVKSKCPYVLAAIFQFFGGM